MSDESMNAMIHCPGTVIAGPKLFTHPNLGANDTVHTVGKGRKE